jgi:predicted small secreted protein
MQFRGDLIMTSIKRSTFYLVALAMMTFVSSETVLAACNATVNGRPMTIQECAQTIQVYGRVVPGNYMTDAYGNWININNPWHRGNIYSDAQRNAGGSLGGRSLVGPSTVYDSTGGCEGGSCVNILD